MKIKKLKFSIKEHKENYGLEDYNIDYVRPLFFFTWSLYFVGDTKANNLADLILKLISYVFLGGIYLCLDIVLLPYKIFSLMSWESKNENINN